MKAISLWEPWALAMRLELKRNETRSWPTGHRGDLLICASKRPLDSVAIEVLEYIRRHTTIRPCDPMPGYALCVVRLVRCDRITPTYAGDNCQLCYETALGDYTPGRFAWVTDNVRRVKPFTVTGRQGLFDVPDDIVNAARAAWMEQ